MKTLGIAIPTHSKHLNSLPLLLDSISLSTVLPKQVSISVSSYDGEVILKQYPFEVILNVSKEQYNASQNRNIAASKLDTDIISFIDSDDLSHSKRNEYLIKAFDSSSTIVVHNYYVNRCSDIRYVNCNIGEPDINFEYIDTLNGSGITSSKGPHRDYTNGHVTVIREIFNNYKFQENWTGWGEDVDFNRRVVEGGYKITYIGNKLSLYVNGDINNSWSGE
jgi:glycosyltransferase involved in cell wall biosynthesis